MNLDPYRYCKFLFFTLTGVWSICPVFAANDNYLTGARFSGMGNVGVTYPDLWSVSHNQAGLGFYHHLSAGVHYENRFTVPEFGLNSVAFTFPVTNGTFGISYSYFGYSAYHESKAGLAFGKALNEWFSAGVQFSYLNTHVADETGNINGMAIEAGIIAKPVKDLSIGIHIYNPTGSSFLGLPEKERIPVVLNIGLSYDLDDKLFLGMEVTKDLEMIPASFKAGLEYELIRHFYIRTGVMINESVSHSFGAGLEAKKIHFDFALTHQQVIGLTPHFSVQYCFR